MKDKKKYVPTLHHEKSTQICAFFNEVARKRANEGASLMKK